MIFPKITCATALASLLAVASAVPTAVPTSAAIVTVYSATTTATVYTCTSVAGESAPTGKKDVPANPPAGGVGVAGGSGGSSGGSYPPPSPNAPPSGGSNGNAVPPTGEKAGTPANPAAGARGSSGGSYPPPDPNTPPSGASNGNTVPPNGGKGGVPANTPVGAGGSSGGSYPPPESNSPPSGGSNGNTVPATGGKGGIPTNTAGTAGGSGGWDGSSPPSPGSNSPPSGGPNGNTVPLTGEPAQKRPGATAAGAPNPAASGVSTPPRITVKYPAGIKVGPTKPSSPVQTVWRDDYASSDYVPGPKDASYDGLTENGNQFGLTVIRTRGDTGIYKSDCVFKALRPYLAPEAIVMLDLSLPGVSRPAADTGALRFDCSGEQYIGDEGKQEKDKGMIQLEVPGNLAVKFDSPVMYGGQVFGQRPEGHIFQFDGLVRGPRESIRFELSAGDDKRRCLLSFSNPQDKSQVQGGPAIFTVKNLDDTTQQVVQGLALGCGKNAV